MDRDRGVDGRRVGPERVEPEGLETEQPTSALPEGDVEVLRQDTSVVLRRDSARWGAIWAGLFTAVTTFLLLELLAFGIGLIRVGPDIFTPQDQPNPWVSVIIGLIAFFAGGVVAGITSSVRGPITGALNGFLVWALGIVLILLLSALGLGQVFGALGNFVGQLGLLQPGGINAPNPNLPNVDPQQVLGFLRTAALWTFLGMLLSAVASALGGWLGGRTDRPIGHVPRPRHRV